MADNVKIDLADNSKYRVALDLTYKILHEEVINLPEKKTQFLKDPRAYMLTLYAQCHDMVLHSRSASEVLK
jgi:hypothetical protein